MLDLIRTTQNDKLTMGILRYEDKFWTTVERPWLGNQPDISCIPTGLYTMRRFYDVNGYRSSKSINQEYVWEICDVDGRTVILVHVANYPHNVEGCIGLGMGILPNRDGIGNSRNAIKEFYEATSHETEMEINIWSIAA